MNGSTAVDALVIGGGATGAGLLRDLARRGLRTLLVEKSDLGTGTSGRYHGLLHSGGRYVVTDPVGRARVRRRERDRPAHRPACVEDTGGYFVATPDDPDDYVDGFPAACAASGVRCDEVAVAAVRAREPALSPALKRAFRGPGCDRRAVAADRRATSPTAASRGGDAWPYHRVVAMRRSGARHPRGRRRRRAERDRSATITRRIVVSAAGAWAGGSRRSPARSSRCRPARARC